MRKQYAKKSTKFRKSYWWILDHPLLRAHPIQRKSPTEKENGRLAGQGPNPQDRNPEYYANKGAGKPKKEVEESE